MEAGQGNEDEFGFPLKRTHSLPSIKRSASLTNIKATTLHRTFSRSSVRQRRGLDDIDWSQAAPDLDLDISADNEGVKESDLPHIDPEILDLIVNSLSSFHFTSDQFKWKKKKDD